MRLPLLLGAVVLAAACATAAPSGSVPFAQDAAAGTDAGTDAVAQLDATAADAARVPDVPGADAPGTDVLGKDAGLPDAIAADGASPDFSTVDSALDAAKDTPVVVPPDSATDLAADVVKDAALDGAPDAAKDTPADVAPDLAPDVPKLGADQCTSEQSCNGQMCLSPGQTMPCGMCFQVEDGCAADKECNPPATVCKPKKCACGGESTCQAGCKATAECAQGFFCAPTGKCVEDVCLIVDPPGKDKSCKPNFVCKNAANPHCFRKTCAKSSECEGHCVNGQCYAAPGACIYPPP